MHNRNLLRCLATNTRKHHEANALPLACRCHSKKETWDVHSKAFAVDSSVAHCSTSACRIADDQARAVVPGLVPAATYVYQLYMRIDYSSREGLCKVTVNHGRIGSTGQTEFLGPRFAGVAVATPRGEIIFEFERIDSRCALSGIAIVAVARPSALLETTSRVSYAPSARVTRGFFHLDLYQQCDTVLMLGGAGVEQCGRPSHRTIDSHPWQHKRCG